VLAQLHREGWKNSFEFGEEEGVLVMETCCGQFVSIGDSISHFIVLFPEKIYSNCIMIKVLIFREREPRPSFEMDTIRCIYTKLVLVVVSVRHKFKGPRPEFAVLEGRLTS
jgi:hypothetical protein